QLGEFQQLVGCDAPAFVVPHDFALSEALGKPIRAIEGGPALMDYIESLDVPAIKRRVYRGTVAHFAQRADEFIERVDDVAASLRTATREFEARAHQAAQQYDPTPGAAIGGLFHDFVQSKRGFPFKMVGEVGRVFVTTVSAIGRTVRGAVMRRATLEPATERTDAALRAMHAESIERIARGLAAGYFESVRNLREPAAHLIQSGLRNVDTERAINTIITSTLRSDNVSEEFRAYAYQTLETWWQEHSGKRIALQTLDGILAVAPAAFAGVLAAHTAGMGVDVALAVGGPMAEQFAARVIEYQFGDALFDFLTPWRNEQRAAFEQALLREIAAPSLRDAHKYLAVLDGDIMSEMRRLQALCSKA
ncbi:MAG: hypothetical protein SGI88_19365, partial [Candidatus Hydrogenedentes bacterium]|nr:hypothetical protein [Candidatus Hydrogenedentota bacterium]